MSVTVASTATKGTATPVFTDYQYVVAYVTIIVIMMLISRTKLGYNTVYYSLALLLFGLVLIHGDVLTNLLKPISGQA